MITAFKNYIEVSENSLQGQNQALAGAIRHAMSTVRVYSRNRLVSDVIKSLKATATEDTETATITMYNGARINIVIIRQKDAPDKVSIDIDRKRVYERKMDTGFNYTNLTQVVKALFLESLDAKGITYEIKESNDTKVENGEVKLRDNAWEIERVISVFTEDDPEYQTNVVENALPLMSDMVPKDVKRGDTIYITAMFKPKNNSAAYLPGQLGVLQVRVIDIFMGLSKLKQINKNK